MLNEITSKVLKPIVALLMVGSLLAFGCSVQEDQVVATIVSLVIVVITMLIFMMVQLNSGESNC